MADNELIKQAFKLGYEQGLKKQAGVYDWLAEKLVFPWWLARKLYPDYDENKALSDTNFRAAQVLGRASRIEHGMADATKSYNAHRVKAQLHELPVGKKGLLHNFALNRENLAAAKALLVFNQLKRQNPELMKEQYKALRAKAKLHEMPIS
jgi:hypothetical protein